jgi:hypothetical protein
VLFVEPSWLLILKISWGSFPWQAKGNFYVKKKET